MIEQDSIRNVTAVKATLCWYFGAHKISFQQMLVRKMVVFRHLRVKKSRKNTSSCIRRRAPPVKVYMLFPAEIYVLMIVLMDPDSHPSQY